MSFIIRTLIGKEKIVQAVLQKRGRNCRTTPFKGLVTEDDAPPSDIHEMPQVLRVLEADPEEIDRLFCEKAVPQKGIEVGSVVEIKVGAYAGFQGLVSEISAGQAMVDIGVYGRVVPVQIDAKDMEIVKLPEPWD